MIALDVQGVAKSFDRRTALNDISFRVEPGTIYGLIGPDGAGKTTMFRIVASLLLPDSGSVQLGAYDVLKQYKQVRRVIGYMPGKFSLYPDLTVEENLRFFARIFGVRVADHYDMIKPVYGSIEKFKDRRAKDLSGGMKQKLALSCALVHKPEFLLLDEPTTGVDPVSRQEFWDGLLALRESGLTILVSTAYMDEAERCDRISLIQEGGILATGSPQELVAGQTDELWSVGSSDRVQLIKWLRSRNDIGMVYPQGSHVVFQPDSDFKVEDFDRELRSLDIAVTELTQVEPTIEDVFIQKLKTIDGATG